MLYIGKRSTALVAPEDHRYDADPARAYPSRTAFSEMLANREYQQITHLRTEALSKAVLPAPIPSRARGVAADRRPPRPGQHAACRLMRRPRSIHQRRGRI